MGGKNNAICKRRREIQDEIKNGVRHRDIKGCALRGKKEGGGGYKPKQRGEIE